MPQKVIEKAKVDANGNISGLAAHAGEDVYVVAPPRLEGHAPGRAKEAVDELVRYVRQHRELAERQYRDFTGRFGTPQERIKELTKDLTPEEFQRRTKELAEFTQKRASEVRKEVEETYRRLEGEIEHRAETLFRKERKAKNANGATVVLDERAAAGSVENRAEREF